MEGIDNKVKEIIASTLGVTIEKIEDETAIGDLVEWDSLHHIRIIAAIEKEFGFRFTPDVMMDLEDVSDIVSATEERANK